jgi:hypothetical protein
MDPSEAGYAIGRIVGLLALAAVPLWFVLGALRRFRRPVGAGQVYCPDCRAVRDLKGQECARCGYWFSAKDLAGQPPEAA